MGTLIMVAKIYFSIFLLSYQQMTGTSQRLEKDLKQLMILKNHTYQDLIEKMI